MLDLAILESAYCWTGYYYHDPCIYDLFEQFNPAHDGDVMDKQVVDVVSTRMEFETIMFMLLDSCVFVSVSLTGKLINDVLYILISSHYV